MTFTYLLDTFSQPFCASFVQFQKLYKQKWDETKAAGYQLNHQYIPLLSGKKSREIASDVSIIPYSHSLISQKQSISKL